MALLVITMLVVIPISQFAAADNQNKVQQFQKHLDKMCSKNDSHGYRGFICQVITDLNGQVTTLTAQNAGLQNDINSLTAQNAGLQSEINLAVQDISAKDTVIDSLNSQIDSLNSDIDLLENGSSLNGLT